MEIFEINGIKYQRKPEKSIKTNKTLSKFVMMSAMLAGMSGMDMGFKESERPNVDIIQEYNLI